MHRDWTVGLKEAPIPAAYPTPESFEVEEPHTHRSDREFVEYLSLTISCTDDLEFLLRMQTLGRKAS